MKSSNASSSENQGVKGYVTWVEGNLMPTYGMDKKATDTKGKPVEREVWFCKPLKMNDVEGEGSIFKNLDDYLVKKAESNEEGFYSVQLPTGSYSIFTKEEDGYFANSFNGEGYINLVEVEEGKMTESDIEINYKATY